MIREVWTLIAADPRTFAATIAELLTWRAA